MRTRLAAIPLLAGALLLGACGDSGDASDDAATTPTPTSTSTSTATEDGTAAAEPTQADLVSEDLPDGVAARVGDTEISVETLEERLAVIRDIPEVAEQLEGDAPADYEAQLQSQALGQLVLQQVVLQGAAEEDVQIDDEQVEARRSELASEAGGEEAFAEQLAGAGVPEGQVGQELRASIAFEVVTEKLLADAGGDAQASETPTEGGTAAGAQSQQAQQLQQNWLVELVSNTEVVVDEEYGAWNPTSGQVVPA